MADGLLFALDVAIKCPYCESQSHSPSERTAVVRIGHFRRRSDRKWIQRWRCEKCRRSFSRATLDPCYRQKKRQHNEMIRRLLCAGVSQRDAGRILRLNRKTIVRKFLFLATWAEHDLELINQALPRVQTLEFDDMETFEHSKCKPLSITLAVESKTRRILDVEVSQMPAKGRLAAIARKKYGPRKDHRPEGRAKLFARIQASVHPSARIKSDQNPHYPPDVKKYFPRAIHRTHKGRRGCVVGQGELKRGGFDPIFSLNHTCAMNRAKVNRLFRRTWCTTKRPDRLRAHLILYAVSHNLTLQEK